MPSNMATFIRRLKQFVTYSTLILLVSALSKGTPKQDIVLQWASQIDEKLSKLSENFSDIVSMVYQGKPLDKPFSIPDLKFNYALLNETIVAEEMAASVSGVLKKHLDALEKSVKAAEAAAAAYKWNSNLKKDDVTYMNAKELNEKGIELTFSEKFEKPVTYNFSSVHVPVEIYDGNIDILNGLNWTAALEEQFRKNKDDDPDILWQYFGSQTGFLRIYPAAQWPKDDVDLYDVRRQSWYTQGSSSPKDVMIIIDTSGSTHGQSLQLIQNSVKSILDTLGENDYVNTISFAEQANFVSKCFNRTAFVQATFRNKRRLIKDIDKLVAFGQADFGEAIRFAFERFNEFTANSSNVNNIGANCNKVMMLLTDGGTDTAEDVFSKYNWPNKTVRVFTYAVGPTPNPVKALRWMACANRGYFSQIPAMGAIRARVQDYMSILDQPLALENVRLITWTGIRRDTFYEEGSNLGMMTTVTLPVYNRSVDSTNQTILGVMAIDVTTAQLEAMTPFSKIGPNGYSFAINPNGYVVFHPNLQTTGKFMTQPPNIDLLELEIEQENMNLQNLRENMIEGKSGSTIITTLFLSPDKRYVSSDEADYAYLPIINTNFRLGLCVPTYQRKYLQFSGNLAEFDWSTANSSIFKILIAPWHYHIKEVTDSIDDIASLSKTEKNSTNWMQLVHHLYWDINHIPPLEKFLETDYKNRAIILNDNETLSDQFGEGENNRAFFIMTSGGMTAVSPPSEVEYFHEGRDVRKSSVFRRALHTLKCIFVTDYIKDKRSNSSSTPYVVTARAIVVTDAENKAQVIDKPAVVGLRLTHDMVINTLINATTEQSSNNINCESDLLHCYLVDDGGFLVATTRDDYREQIGRFFGEVDPPVFEAVRKVFFQRSVQYDFQATCVEEDNLNSAGFRDFSIPSINILFDLLNIGWWTSKVTWAFTIFDMYSWFSSSSTQVYADDDNEEDHEKECVKATYQYYIKSTVKHITDSIACQNCTRNLTAVVLNKTNLIFIVVDKVCEECEEMYPPVSQSPKELSETEEEDIVCEMADNPMKRIRPESCFDYDKREDVSECGCASLQVSCMAVVLVLITVAHAVNSMT